MRESRGKADLAHEALTTERVSHVRAKHLHGDIAIMLEVAREVHRRHAAGTEGAQDRVSIGEGVAESCRDRGHRSGKMAARSVPSIGLIRRSRPRVLLQPSVATEHDSRG